MLVCPMNSDNSEYNFPFPRETFSNILCVKKVKFGSTH